MPPVRTQARSATILPNFVGLTFEVHNGKDYHQVVITEDMVGHKLGEFSPLSAMKCVICEHRSDITVALENRIFGISDEPVLDKKGPCV